MPNRDMDSFDSDSGGRPVRGDGGFHSSSGREEKSRARGLREGGWRDDLEQRSFHLDETQTDTRLLFVDNLYNAMEVIGGVRDCTAHSTLQDIADAWNATIGTHDIEFRDRVRKTDPRLADLLDALEGTDDE